MGFAANKAAFAVQQQKGQSPDSVAAGLWGVGGSAPPPSTRQAVGGGSSTPPGLNPPADSFTPSDAGASGAGTQVPRDQEAKKDRCVGVVPLFTEGDAYAVIQLVPDQGGGGQGAIFEDFVLTSVQKESSERYHIYETFKLPILYTMDKAPELYVFAGYVYTGRTPDGKVWQSELYNFYEQKMRATKLAEASLKAFISYNNVIVGGYVLNLRLPEDGQDPLHAQFSFGMFVTDIKHT